MKSLYIILETILQFSIVMLVMGCDALPPQSEAAKQAQLVKVTVREVMMKPSRGGNDGFLVYIVQDGVMSKTALVRENISYVPVPGDEVMVSGWGGGIWGETMIESVVTKTKAEVDYP